MPTSAQNPEVPATEAPSTTEEDHVPATATATATATAKTSNASPEHERAETTQKASAKGGGDNEADLPLGLTTNPRPTRAVECNAMSYTDGGGVARRIYMPKGTMGLAAALYTSKRFDDLARFPAWDNQTYDDWEADEGKYVYLRDNWGDLPHDP